jgi:hypothetical protein
MPRAATRCTGTWRPAPPSCWVGRRSGAENLVDAEKVLTPLVERGVSVMVENCPKVRLVSRRSRGQLAYSPELCEWMFDLGLDLIFDPSHLPGVAAAPPCASAGPRCPGTGTPYPGSITSPRSAHPAQRGVGAAHQAAATRWGCARPGGAGHARRPRDRRSTGGVGIPAGTVVVGGAHAAHSGRSLLGWGVRHLGGALPV